MRIERQFGWCAVTSLRMIALAGGLGLLLPLGGCGPKDVPVEQTGAGHDSYVTGGHDDHGHSHGEHDHAPENLAEAVSQLEAISTKVTTALAASDLESVHHELHEVGHLLEWVEGKVIAGEGLADGAQEGAQQAVTSLFEAFGTMDDSLHGNADADIQGAATKITDSLKQLKDSLK